MTSSSAALRHPLLIARESKPDYNTLTQVVIHRIKDENFFFKICNYPFFIQILEYLDSTVYELARACRTSYGQTYRASFQSKNARASIKKIRTNYIKLFDGAVAELRNELGILHGNAELFINSIREQKLLILSHFLLGVEREAFIQKLHEASDPLTFKQLQEESKNVENEAFRQNKLCILDRLNARITPHEESLFENANFTQNTLPLLSPEQSESIFHFITLMQPVFVEARRPKNGLKRLLFPSYPFRFSPDSCTLLLIGSIALCLAMLIVGNIFYPSTRDAWYQQRHVLDNMSTLCAGFPSCGDLYISRRFVDCQAPSSSGEGYIHLGNSTHPTADECLNHILDFCKAACDELMPFTRDVSLSITGIVIGACLGGLPVLVGLCCAIKLLSDIRNEVNKLHYFPLKQLSPEHQRAAAVMFAHNPLFFKKNKERTQAGPAFAKALTTRLKLFETPHLPLEAPPQPRSTPLKTAPMGSINMI